MIILNDGLFSSGERIAVALSGGEDSVCLLHLLKKNAERLNIQVVAVNVEHGIRGEASKNDTAFCAWLCESLGVELKVFTVDAPSFAAENSMSLEQAARVLRYDCFFKALEGGFCHKIATAHHLSDNVETVLFNLFRGSSLTGLCGISESAYGKKIIRPILGTEKDDITAYIKENGVKYVYDETNFDTAYTRNAIRRDIMPRVKEIFPAAERSIEKFSQSAKRDDEFLYRLARKNLVEEKGAFKISVDLEYPIFSRCAVLAIKGLGVEKDYDNRHIDALFTLKSNQTGRESHLLKNVKAVKEHGYIVLRRGVEKIEEFVLPFKLGETKIGDKTVRVERVDGFQKEPNAWFLDLDKIPKGSVFRLKREGDRIEKFGGGEVSLKKYLTDKKVPSYEKDRKIVLANENNVIWVENIDISYAVKIDKTSQNIVKLTIF